jgi:hypothetical protein
MLCSCCSAIAADATLYGVARSAAPVLNTPAFSSIFGGVDRKTLTKDRCGQVRALEFIALPGTVFSILGESRDDTGTVFQVETDDYPLPAGTKLYLDGRFVELRRDKPLPRTRTLPDTEEIITALKGSIGSPYVWGGNVQGGVAELIELFYGDKVSDASKRQLILAGLDCSGLIYQATNGWTPRNTSQLVSYGRGVRIAGKTVKTIAKLLEPLDLIVWNGHVIIVLDRNTVIESRLECGKQGYGGVMTTPMAQRLREIIRTRRPVDEWPAVGKRRDVFVVRRWLVP